MKNNKTVTVLLIAVGLLLVGMFMTRSEGFNNPPGLKACTKKSDCPQNSDCKGNYCVSVAPITIIRKST